MAEVSGLHRFHFPTTTYPTVTIAAAADDDDDEEYLNAFSFGFDSLSPPNNQPLFTFSPNFRPGHRPVDSDSGSDLGLFCYEDQVNFVTDTDLSVARERNDPESPDFGNRHRSIRVYEDDVFFDRNSNFRVNSDADFDPESPDFGNRNRNTELYSYDEFFPDDEYVNRNRESRVYPDDDFVFGSEFDEVLITRELNEALGNDGLRVVGIGSDSDSDEVELNSGVPDRNGELDVNIIRNSLRIDDDDRRGLSEDFEWEEVNERGEERDFLSSVIDGIEEISVSSDISSNSNDGEHEPVRNLEWEVLLAVNNVERNFEFDGINDGINHVYDAEYDALFGQILENEGTFNLKGRPPAAKSVVENLPLVDLKDEDNKTACAVCKDDILVEEKVTELPCSHHYHWDCIVPWLNIRNTCPVCRHELPTDDADYERRRKGRGTGAGAEVGNDFQVRYNFEIVP